MVFGVIAGGMYVMLGPTVGAAFTLLLAEGLRLALGEHFKQFPALDLAIYGCCSCSSSSICRKASSAPRSTPGKIGTYRNCG
jgi:ABC-type branched-subunit amino acid transport system permease subunit